MEPNKVIVMLRRYIKKQNPLKKSKGISDEFWKQISNKFDP